MDIQKSLSVISEGKKRNAYIVASVTEIEDISEQFESLVTMVELQPDEFHDLNGKFQPTKAATLKMADAAGIIFLPEHCGTRTKGNWSDVKLIKMEGVFQATGDYGIIGFAAGERRGPDGVMRQSQKEEYEFSVTDRFNVDRIGEKWAPDTELKAWKKLLEVKKYSVRRASTGAELAVCRALAKIPTAFKPADIKRPFIFSQIVKSQKYTNKLITMAMESPEGREQLLNKTLGITKNLYGTSGSQENPKQAQLPENTAAEVSDDIPGMEEPEIEDDDINQEDASLRNQLIEWETSGKVVYLNDKVGNMGDPHMENLTKIRKLLREDPINTDKAYKLLDGLTLRYSRKNKEF